MLEKNIEEYLINEVKKQGGIAYKFIAGIRGVPDRILLLPGGRIAFVELKAPGEKARPLQEKRMQQIMDLGFKVALLDSKESIDYFLRPGGM